MPTASERTLKLAQKSGAIRPRDLASHGIAPVYLRRLVKEGKLTQSGRGLYCLPNFKVTEFHSLAEAGKRVPKGTVCLLSALRFHRLTTQAPFEVWMAIDVKAERPRVDHPPLRIVRFSGKALTDSADIHKIEGVEVRIYSAAKTVADCFKYRNKIGLDVALEALRDYLRKYRGKTDELWQQAAVCRVQNVIRPYLEAMT